MNIGQEFGAHVVTMSPEDTIQEAAWKMDDQHVGSVIVAHGGKEIVGIVTDRDIALKLAAGEAHPATPVSEIMSTSVRTIRANGSIADAIHYFKSYQIKRLPIINEDGNLIGIVSLDDVLSKLTDQLKDLSDVVAARLVSKDR